MEFGKYIVIKLTVGYAMQLNIKLRNINKRIGKSTKLVKSMCTPQGENHFGICIV